MLRSIIFTLTLMAALFSTGVFAQNTSSQNGVTASAVSGTTSIAVSWTNTCGICKWRISWQLSSHLMSPELPNNINQYTITGLHPGQEYLIKMEEKRANRWISRALLTANTSGFSIYATPLGTLQSETLKITLNPQQSAVGVPGSLFVAANLANGSWYSLTSTGAWQLWAPNYPIPAYSTSSKLPAINTITAFSNWDLTHYVGARIFAGYGVSSQAMLSNNTYALVNTIPKVLDSHYFKVTQSLDKIVAIHQIRISDNKEAYTAYPYGRAFVTPTAYTQQLSQNDFEGFMLPHVAKSAPSATPTPSSDLQIGYNPSTGQTQGQCYNFETEQPAAEETRTTFSLDNAASSSAQQTHISASVGGSYRAFSANDNFSYSDQSQHSSNSGTAYSKGWILYSLSIYPDTTTPLTPYGQSINPEQFAQICGTQYMSTVQAGMLVIGTVAWQSDSSTASQDMSNTLTASYGQAFNLKTTATVASNASNANSSLSVTLTSEGGGTAASAIITSATTALAPYLATCANISSSSPSPNPAIAACDNYSTGINAAIGQALQTFETTANSPAWLSSIGDFALFPNNVAGSPPVALNTQLAPTKPYTDLLKPYQSQLTSYLALLNQIETLNKRAGYLSTQVGNADADFNWTAPDTYINLQTTLNALSEVYSGDVSTMIANLGQCLLATAANVTTVCGPIISNTIQDAYTWYSTTGANPNWLAQQNTIALQYVGNFNTTYAPYVPVPQVGQQLPTDIVYINTLPNLTTTAAEAISGLSALAAFADAPYTWGSSTASNQSGGLLPLPTMTDLAQVVTVNTSPLGGFYGVFDSTWFDAGLALTWKYPCSPTFALPCELYYQVNDKGTNWLDMTAIPYLFVPPGGS